MRRAVLQWPGRSEARAGWTNDELAELYRVEHALNQAAFAVETDCGVSDEGDPWFVFCHPDGQVVVHIARIDGLYLLFCLTLPEPLTGTSFVALTKAYVSTLPKPEAMPRAGGVVAHPSALLSLLVAAAMFSVDAFVQHPAHAAELPRASHGDPPLGHPVRPGVVKDAVVKAFSEAFAAAVWRAHGAEGVEAGAAWQAVEQAALGFAALYEANLVTEVAGPTTTGEPAAPLPELSAPPVEGAPRTGADQSLETHAQIDKPDDGRAAVLAGPSRGLIGAADGPRANLMDPAPATMTGLAGAIDAGGDGPGAMRWRPAVPGSSTKTAGVLGVLAPALDDGAAGLPLISDSERDLAVTLAAGGETLDLAAGGLWRLVVSGQGDLTLVNAGAAESIAFANHTTADIDLFYDAASSSAPVSQRLALGGAAHVSLAESAPPEGQPVRLVVDSHGAKANDLSLLDTAPGQGADFNLTITGRESLTLHESAATFAASRLDASELAGTLTIGVDLGDGAAGATVLNFDSGNFIVDSQGSVALENLGDNATIKIDVDLNSAIFGLGGRSGSATGPLALALDLGAVGQNAPVEVGLIDANGVDKLSIASSGGDNVAQTIIDPALTNLQLTGGGALEIDAILGVKAIDGQSVDIDASGLTGFLTLNAGGISDLAAGGRSVSIALGAGGGAVTDMNASEAVTVTLGAGQGRLYFADGATHVAIAGLKSADQVSIGDATVADAFVNGVALSPSQQTSVDAAANLLVAATTAATAAGASAAHQAVLFSYKGGSYVFVDVAGNHVFDPSLDAIIKLVGVLPTTDFAGVFHSA
jgi:hypothetical protein